MSMIMTTTAARANGSADAGANANANAAQGRTATGLIVPAHALAPAGPIAEAPKLVIPQRTGVVLTLDQVAPGVAAALEGDRRYVSERGILVPVPKP